MNPNPEQPDAPPFTTGKCRVRFSEYAGEAQIGTDSLYIAHVQIYQIPRKMGLYDEGRRMANADLIAKAFNAATALHAAGWNAARVFERLPEALRLAELCVRAQENIESLWNSENTPSIRELNKGESERVEAIATLKSFLAQLKRDTLKP